MSLLTAKELQDIVQSVQADEALPLADITEGWLHWFKKKGDRCIKDAAKLGYTEITMDLPIEIAVTMDRASLLTIQKTLRELLDGCVVAFVEDEYQGKPLCRLFVSWSSKT